MGTSNGPYVPDFPRGTLVRIRERDFLEKFQREWQYHNNITTEQLSYAGAKTLVVRASVYFGGDELYTLENVPGIWHEQCLVMEATTSRDDSK